MSANQSDWQLLFSELERVYATTARLLKDVDGLMERSRYALDSGKENAVGMQTSAALSRPSFWFPGWVSRHYIGDTAGVTHRRYVGVLFHNRSGDDIPTLAEPVVTAGLVLPTQPGDPRWWYWFAKAWGFAEAPVANGEVVERTVGGGAWTIRCFAVPLSALTDVATLNQRVVQPALGIRAR
jgi:hypothetical protein